MAAYVVPKPCRSRGGELESQFPPSCTRRGIGGHVVSLPIVIPRADEMARLDVSGSSELEGGSSW